MFGVFEYIFRILKLGTSFRAKRRLSEREAASYSRYYSFLGLGKEVWRLLMNLLRSVIRCHMRAKVT